MLVLISSIQMSCVQTPIKESAPDYSKKLVMAWRGKALIFDKIKDKKNTVALEVVSRRPKNMRIDISATLGIYVGSFVWNEHKMEILLARDKKFIVGPASADSMQEILKMQIDPQALLDVFWEQPLSPREWNCERDRSELTKLCKHKTLAVQIIWQERSPRHRLIEIDSQKVNTQLSLNEVEEAPEIKASTFQLRAPEGFKNITLWMRTKELK